MRLAWNPGGKDWSISYESSRGKVQYDVNVTDAQYVEVKSCLMFHVFSSSG